MRLVLLILSIVVIGGGFLVYMSTYTVRFTETAVVTTFGKADESSVVESPGLKWKLPSPIQSATVYDTRARFLDTRLEQQQTRDARQIVVESFLAWRVSDPLVFYQKFSSDSGARAEQQYRDAEDILRSLLRSAMSEISNYELVDLLSPSRDASRIPELEQRIKSRLESTREDGGADVSQYGITVELVGIKRMELPEETTRQVFERMKETRRRIAASAEAEGTARATSIKSDAQNARNRILEFARVRAAQIRAEGDREAARYLSRLDEEPDLAVFLQHIEWMRQGLGKRTTLILPTTMGGVKVFERATMDAVNEGRIPDLADPILTGTGEGQQDQP